MCPPSVGCLGDRHRVPAWTAPTALPALAFPAFTDILQLLLFSFISLAPCFCNLRGFFEFWSHVFQAFAEPLRERLVCPAVCPECPWSALQSVLGVPGLPWGLSWVSLVCPESVLGVPGLPCSLSWVSLVCPGVCAGCPWSALGSVLGVPGLPWGLSWMSLVLVAAACVPGTALPTSSVSVRGTAVWCLWVFRTGGEVSKPRSLSDFGLR